MRLRIVRVPSGCSVTSYVEHELGLVSGQLVHLDCMSYDSINDVIMYEAMYRE